MRKFECKQCAPPTPCVIECGDYYKPNFCTCFQRIVDWREVKVESKLPKLTVEALAERGIEWPEWAKYAAVDSDQYAHFFKGPVEIIYADDCDPWWANKRPHFPAELISGKWDNSGWQNSLINRPAVVKQNLTTELPEWCRVGAWCVYVPTKRFYEIESIDSVRRRIRTTDQTKENSGWEPTFESFLGAYRPARVRPWTLKEAPLFSKIVFRGNFGIATLYYHCNERKFGYNINHRDICAFVALEDMVCDFTLLDGSPCGVLEVVE